MKQQYNEENFYRSYMNEEEFFKDMEEVYKNEECVLVNNQYVFPTSVDSAGFFAEDALKILGIKKEEADYDMLELVNNNSTTWAKIVNPSDYQNFEGARATIRSSGRLLEALDRCKKEVVPMSSYALEQMYKTCISREGDVVKTLSKTSPGELREWVNEDFARRNTSIFPTKPILLKKRFGMIHAVLSEFYKNFNANKAIEIMKNEFFALGYELLFNTGAFENNEVHAQYDSQVMGRDISSIYGDMDEDAMVSLVFVTGDFGNRAVSIFPYLKSKTTSGLIGKPVTMNHVGEVDEKTWGNLVNSTYALIRDSAEKLKKAQSIVIKHPLGALKNIQEHCRITKDEKVVGGVEDEFVFYHVGEDNTCSAFDLFNYVADMISAMERDEYSKTSTTACAERLAQILQAESWTRYDKIYEGKE